MLTIGIDSSTEVGAIGLINDEELLAEINISLYRRHSKRLLPNIKYMLEETGFNIKDLEGIAVTVGPGSFTGLRIGLSTVKAFAQFLNIPIIGLSTLDVLAYNLHHLQAWLVPVIDARRNRVYTSLYRGGNRDIKASKEWDERAITVAQLLIELKKVSSISDINKFYLLGNGVSAYQKKLDNTKLKITCVSKEFNKPRGGIVAALGQYYLKKGEYDDVYKILPNYLKKPQAVSNFETGG